MKYADAPAASVITVAAQLIYAHSTPFDNGTKCTERAYSLQRGNLVWESERHSWSHGASQCVTSDGVVVTAVEPAVFIYKVPEAPALL